ncbi:MAG: transaldolase [Pontimonas sp.]|jgi:transaldolase
MTLTPTDMLAEVGVSIWLDDLSKDRLTSGSLRSLMEAHTVVGVTSNPTIFAGSVAGSDSYQVDIQEMAAQGLSAEDAAFAIMVSDVQAACDLLRGVYDATKGVDGRVSLEVSPTLAHDTDATIAQALALWKQVDRVNLMVKIPATLAGIPAITHVVAQGVSVNVTLIFSLERHREVIAAYVAGIALAAENGHDISTIHSVASFFVSRVDSAIDPQLENIGTPEALALKSRAAIANARLAYELFEQLHATPEARALIAQGMNYQRPLWASTGVKDPTLPETLYVTELAVANTVNTMPEKTLLATARDGGVDGDRVHGHYDDARAVMVSLADLGISLDSVTEELEREGVEKFIASWHELLETVTAAMEGSAPA